MLKNLKIYSKLKKIAEGYSSSIVDIILFGSVVKSKTEPKDIDICLIFRDDVSLDIVKDIGSKLGEKVHVSSLSINNFLNKKHSLVQTLLFEGISVKSGNRISENYSLDSHALYYYDISDMKKSDKVRFVYLLKGRKKGVGLVNKFGGEFLVPGCFIVPVEKDNEVLEIFNKWKIKFKRKK